MTYEEAFDWLIHKISIDVQNSCDIPKDIECLETCEKALGKQIPKKPLDIEVLGTIKNGGIIALGKCPECFEHIGNATSKNGCCNCLQALDWSEEE